MNEFKSESQRDLYLIGVQHARMGEGACFSRGRYRPLCEVMGEVSEATSAYDAGFMDESLRQLLAAYKP